jgi:hypothetical protein
VVPLVCDEESRDKFLTRVDKDYGKVEVVDIASNFPGFTAFANRLGHVDVVVHTVETDLSQEAQELVAELGMEKADHEVTKWAKRVSTGFLNVFLGCSFRKPVFVVVGSSIIDMRSVDIEPRLWSTGVHRAYARGEIALSEKVDELRIKGEGIIHMVKPPMALGSSIRPSHTNGRHDTLMTWVAKEVAKAMNVDSGQGLTKVLSRKDARQFA